MKGISVIVASVLLIAISIAAITLALNIGNPSIERSKEILILNQGKENLLLIDSAIDQVMKEGDGSSRKLTLQVTGGKYTVTDNYIEFEMDTLQQIVGEGVEGSEGDMYIIGEKNKIYAYLEYDFIFIGEKIILKGTHQLVISNQGGNIEIS